MTLLESDHGYRQSLVVETDSRLERRDLAEERATVVDSEIVVRELESDLRARVPSLEKLRQSRLVILVQRRQPSLVISAKRVPSRAAGIQFLTRGRRKWGRNRGDYCSAKCERLSLRLAAVDAVVPELELHRVDVVEPEREQHLWQLELRDAEVVLQVNRRVGKGVDATPKDAGANEEHVGVFGLDVDLMPRRGKQIGTWIAQRKEV